MIGEQQQQQWQRLGDVLLTDLQGERDWARVGVVPLGVGEWGTFVFAAELIHGGEGYAQSSGWEFSRINRKCCCMRMGGNRGCEVAAIRF